MSQDQPKDIKKVRGRSDGGKKIRVEVSPNKRSEVETKHVSLPDLNHSGKVQDETKTSLMKKVPLFDLNQISVSKSFNVMYKETNMSFTLCKLIKLIYREKKRKKQKQ